MSRPGESLPGALVISLDFELQWGARDRLPRASTHLGRLAGARAAVPRLLELFTEFDIRATWATVGFLFAKDRAELDRFSPAVRPRYDNPNLDPFGEPVGDTEEADPFHYARSLIDRIRETPGQEVATHTFSHYYCGESGQGAESFAADLAAARAIAGARGVVLRSIVFPRNQHNPQYDPILLESGITAYRGNPPSSMWRFTNAAEGRRFAKRAERLLSAYVNLGGEGLVAWSEVRRPNGLADVRASAFLRPYSPVLRPLEWLRLRRIHESLVAAARSGRIYHLWWHPHNFGLHLEENLRFLRGVLGTFVSCRERYGMRSLTMADVARLAPRPDARAAGPRQETASPREGRAPTRLLHITTVPMTLNFLHGQVEYMRERGFQVHALSSPHSELQAFGERHDVPVYGVSMPRRVTPLRDGLAVLEIVRVLRKITPDLVHAHTPKGGLLGMIAATIAGVPSRLYHMRGLPLVGAAEPKRTLLRWSEKVACRLAHRVVCVSHSLRRAALSEGLCPADKITVLAGGSGQGVDASGRFNPANLSPTAREDSRARVGIPRGATVVGFVGRIVRDKGVVELGQAWQVLRRDFPHLHLLLVGPFEREDPIPTTLERFLRGDPRVHLLGIDWDTPPLYAAMDLVVLPTYREGLPNVLLEAAAMGLPVVATDIPGCVDVVRDGVTGTLVPVRDPEALAGRIRAYLDDPDLRKRHGAAGRCQVLQEFRPELIWEALYQEYERLRSTRPSPGRDATPSYAPNPWRRGSMSG